MKRGTGLRGAPRLVRTPRDPLYSRITRRDRVVVAAGGAQDGALILDEFDPCADGNPVQIHDGLRLLARWIARAAVDPGGRPKRRKTREKPPRNRRFLP